MEQLTIKSLECRLFQDHTVEEQMFWVRVEGEKDGINRELWGAGEWQRDERLKGIPLGTKVLITNLHCLYVPQETKSVSGQLAWASGRRGRMMYNLTKQSEVKIIEKCKHDWKHYPSISHDYDDDPYDCSPGRLVCWVNSCCSLCKAYDSGICDPSCPLCGSSMSLEEAYVPSGYVWTCEDCLSSRPLEFGWLEGE